MKKLVLWLLVSLPTLASADHYECRVTNGVRLTATGDLEKGSVSEHYIGTEFIVMEDSGKMVGRLRNSNDFGSPQVIQRGSSEMAYKVITIHEPYPHVQYLFIEEYEQTVDKPFMFIDLNKIYTGLCRRYD